MTVRSCEQKSATSNKTEKSQKESPVEEIVMLKQTQVVSVHFVQSSEFEKFYTSPHVESKHILYLY